MINQVELMLLLRSLTAQERAELLGRSLQSNKAVLRQMELGNIIIDPFNRRNLGNGSYDVTLGPYYYREQNPGHGFTTYSPWSESDVRRVWGDQPLCAQSAKEWIDKHGKLGGIHDRNEIIWIAPGETILCHTLEYIGGRGGIVTTMMKARSSMGRNFIEVCKCAGWGDVGFTNRWTMEITNNSRFYHIPLVVGRRIGQIAFFEVEPIEGDETDYACTGKYQTDQDMEIVKAKWSPEAMLPKMYLDWEIGEP